MQYAKWYFLLFNKKSLLTKIDFEVKCLTIIEIIVIGIVIINPIKDINKIIKNKPLKQSKKLDFGLLGKIRVNTVMYANREKMANITIHAL